MVDYAELFDIEQRPGSGLERWTSTVERQLERVARRPAECRAFVVMEDLT
jgi:hypothetical protein